MVFIISWSLVFVDSVTTVTQLTSWRRSERSHQRFLTCTSTWIITVSVFITQQSPEVLYSSSTTVMMIIFSSIKEHYVALFV